MFPEGVAYHSRTGNFFVGGTTDGTVFRGNVANEGEEAEVFLEPESDGRDTAVGVVDEGGWLFIAGGDTGRILQVGRWARASMLRPSATRRPSPVRRPSPGGEFAVRPAAVEPGAGAAIYRLQHPDPSKIALLRHPFAPGPTYIMACK